MRKAMVVMVTLAGLLATGPLRAEDAIVAAVDGKHRNAANTARDVYRHPAETLSFFGLKPEMTVVEVSPGGGWYTEILAAVVAGSGQLYAAQAPLNGQPAYQRRNLGAFFALLGSNDDLFGAVQVTHFQPPYALTMAPAASADMVVTFRNLHNWIMAQEADGVSGRLAFRAMFDVLKPGGTLGVVDHRWPEDGDRAAGLRAGYVKESEAIALAQAAGFKLVARSDINANAADTHDHPRGVWTLPPSLALGAQDAARYQAIGESDRFTLRFEKPVVSSEG